MVLFVLESGREQGARIRDHRLQVVADTQRYMTAMLDQAIDVFLKGRGGAGRPPQIADYQKADLSYAGDAELVRAWAFWVVRAVAEEGKGLSEPDLRKLAAVGGRLAKAFRDQEERILQGDRPVQVPEADRVVSDPFARSTDGPPSPPV